MTDVVATVTAAVAPVVAAAPAVIAAVPAAADKTWAKIVAFVKKWSGYAYTLEPLWVWWYHAVQNNPKTFAVSIILLALFAIR